MTILFDASAPVKSARRFGAGLLPSRPSYRAPYTAADAEWLIADNARRDAENRHYDRLAAESAAMDRIESGIACW